MSANIYYILSITYTTQMGIDFKCGKINAEMVAWSQSAELIEIIQLERERDTAQML